MNTLISEKKSQIGLDIDQVKSLENLDLVLIIEDNMETLELYKLILREAGLNVVGACNADEGMKKWVAFSPSIVLLDLHMPEIDGFEVIKNMRVHSKVPLMVISADPLEDVKVLALNLGADEYVEKPVSRNELVARVNALLRRSKDETIKDIIVLPLQNISINKNTKEVKKNNNKIKMTPKEYSVFEGLVNAYPKPVEYEMITKMVWGSSSDKHHKSLKWIIHSLRKKLEENPSQPKVIITHTNYGYQLEG
jgi:two-component system KDP operon response regulator KdpE